MRVRAFIARSHTLSLSISLYFFFSARFSRHMMISSRSRISVHTYFWRKWQKKKMYVLMPDGSQRHVCGPHTKNYQHVSAFRLEFSIIVCVCVWIWHVNGRLYSACKCLCSFGNSFQLREINREKGCGKVKHFWDNFCVIYLGERSHKISMWVIWFGWTLLLCFESVLLGELIFLN